MRADPEEAVVKSGGELQIEVAFANVLRFVRERGAQRGVIPLDRFERQQDAMADGRGRAEVEGEADGEIRFQCGEALRATPEAHGEEESEKDTQKEQSGDGEIGCESDLPPREVTGRRGCALQRRGDGYFEPGGRDEELRLSGSCCEDRWAGG